jgi:hypothetical protein
MRVLNAVISRHVGDDLRVSLKYQSQKNDLLGLSCAQLLKAKKRQYVDKE